MHLQWAAIFALLLALVLLLRWVSRAVALRRLKALIPALNEELTVKLGEMDNFGIFGDHFVCRLTSPLLQRLERIARWHRVRLYLATPEGTPVTSQSSFRFRLQPSHRLSRSYHLDSSFGICFYTEPADGATAEFYEQRGLGFTIPATSSFCAALAEHGVTGMRWGLEAFGHRFELRPQPPREATPAPNGDVAEPATNPGQPGQAHLSLTAAPACA